MRLLSTKKHLTEWLEDCPENGIRFVCNSGPAYHLYGYANLLNSDLVTIGHLGVGGDDYNDGGVTITMGPVMDAQMTPQEEQKIERLSHSTPPRKMGSLDRYDFNRNIYFAVWKDRSLQTYVYPQDNYRKRLSIC